MKKTREDYYLGVDIGTNSVGWAVTNENYRLVRFNGKTMWGSRLFDEAQTAEKRRLSRTLRRRLQRRRWRIELLQELFSEEICKVDPGFFQRLKDSTFLPEDKQSHQTNTLFYDTNYTDVEFHREYPTIYHLRKELIQNVEKKDIRLIYLAAHHILKHRGHFLFSGTIENATSFECAFDKMSQCIRDEFEIELNCNIKMDQGKMDDLKKIIQDKKLSKRDKASQFLEYLQYDDKEKQKQIKAIVSLICGSKCKLADIFSDETLKDAKRSSISFSESSFDEIRPELEDLLQERCGVLDILKGVYDWSILADILKGGEHNGNSYLSFAKVHIYKKHQKDLFELKKLIRTYADDQYQSFFQKADSSSSKNYCNYIGSTRRNGKRHSVKKCTYEELTKTIKNIFTNIQHPDAQNRIEKIKMELDAGTYLPLQVSKDNSVIPYQVHDIELKKILENAKNHYAFLNKKDEQGITISEKSIQLFEFRIPYYVGPLNTSVGTNSWMVRKKDGPIRPWNFDEIVDENQSAEKFIRRMTNKCTYLIGKDVLPKHSLLYSEFMVWNELNNLKIKNEPLPVETKIKLFTDLFQKQKQVTPKKILEFLKCEGYRVEQKDISGIDQRFKSSLGSYLEMKKIFGDEIRKQSMREIAEDLILWITLYGEAPKMLKKIIRSKYETKQISDKQMERICKLKYQGWGRLSKEFLDGLEGTSTKTGEVFSIISALRNTNDNLMQLLSSNYTFVEEIEKLNYKLTPELTNFSYETIMADLVASPAIKRAAWQVLLIAEEVKKIMGRQPKKIFIEMARGPKEKRPTDSRQKKLLQLYAKIKDESRDWKKELEDRQESEFRSIKLYLYYTQMGKCMYSGESIDLSRLADTSVYDRDHIYPQSKTKDDSIDNLVLVKRDINLKKSNHMLSPAIQEKMQEFWHYLEDQGLISKEKYRRLTRKSPLTDEELAGFINRQLVETRQSSKVVAELFQRLYNDSDVVYVKAKAVSDFRNEILKVKKCRSLNDYHHAKDAYLNIVVGNVYHEKFTNNPLHWLKMHPSEKEKYNLNQMFNHDVIKKQVIWKCGEKGSLKMVRKQLKLRDIRYTRLATENKCGQNGGFFDSQIVSKTANASVPIKKGMDVTKYGGYKTITPAYFALVTSENKKGTIQKSIEAVPLYLKEAIEKDINIFIDYCKDTYKLKNPSILLPKIKKDTLFVVNGFPMHLRGTTGKQLVFQCAVQLLLDDKYEIYLKNIEKYLLRNLSFHGKELLPITENDGITSIENLEMYDELYRKQRDTIYKNRPASQLETLKKGRNIFSQLPCEKQCYVLNEIINLMRCKPITANLTDLQGSKTVGRLQMSKVISNYSKLYLIHQSVTGLFEQEIDLLSL